MSALNSINKYQQPYNFYLLDDLNKNFVFECTPLNVSYALNTTPAFTDYYGSSSMGFTDVSATTILNINASVLNGLFIFSPVANTTFATNSFDATELDNMYYGVSAEVFKNLPFSSSIVNNTNHTIVEDYIQSLSNDITGSLNTGTSLFKNISQMSAGVTLLDSQFNILLNSGISKNNKQLYDPTTNAYALSCKQLVTGILSLGNNSRISTFLDDVATQVPPYSVIFHPNDTIALKIGYIPKNSVLTGLNPAKYNVNLYTRTYKVLLKLN